MAGDPDNITDANPAVKVLSFGTMPLTSQRLSTAIPASIPPGHDYFLQLTVMGLPPRVGATPPVLDEINGVQFTILDVSGDIAGGVLVQLVYQQDIPDDPVEFLLAVRADISLALKVGCCFFAF